MQNWNQQLKHDELFGDGADGKAAPKAITTIIIFFALWGGSLLAGRILAAPLLRQMPIDTPLEIAIASSLRKILICGLQITVFIGWVIFAENRHTATMGFGGRNRILAYVGSAILGIGAISLIVLSLVLAGAVELRLTDALAVKDLTIPVIVAMLGWMVQSASEEIAIRGWLIPVLGKRYGPLRAVLITGGVFGTIHLFNDGATFLSFFNLTLSGFFFALYVLHAGNIWGACGLHMGWNFAQGNLYGTFISGERSANTIFTCRSTGSDLLTGGAFGPEGGLPATIFLLVGILAVGGMLQRKTAS